MKNITMVGDKIPNKGKRDRGRVRRNNNILNKERRVEGKKYYNISKKGKEVRRRKTAGLFSSSGARRPTWLDYSPSSLLLAIFCIKLCCKSRGHPAPH